MNRSLILSVFSIFLLIMLLSPTGLSNSGIASAQGASPQQLRFTQLSGTTGGELRRYIDISSPWSGGYLYEDLTVIGSASVTESFTMDNLGPGSESDYWKNKNDSFDSGLDIFPDSNSPAAPATKTQTGSVNKKPAAAVAGASVTVGPEDENDVMAGFRWFDLF
jgi:hypothetical protein